MTAPEITITPVTHSVSVRAGGAVIGESSNAVRVREGGGDPVIYVPRDDVGMMFLDPSTHRATHPSFGEATYFHIVPKSKPIENAAWSYEDPAAAAKALKDMLAFDPEKVVVEEV